MGRTLPPVQQPAEHREHKEIIGLPSADKIPATIRPARPADAPAINALYREAYTAPDADPADCHYPFAQFLDPLWVAHAVELELIRWIVAEVDGRVVGTTGALRNIGSDADRVAECFGLVVTDPARKRGIGAALFHSLCDRLAVEAHFIIAEVRTVAPGGWHIVRHCGFHPLGFEPFAHTTPVGSESMLLTARISEQARQGRLLQDRAGSPAAGRLGRAVLGPIGLASLPHEVRAGAQPVEVDSFAGLVPQLTPIGKDRPPATTLVADSGAALDVARGEDHKKPTAAARASANPHESGIVCLHRLEGEDSAGKRYDRRYYVARVDGRVLGSTRLVWDRLDRRIRILDLHTDYDGLQGVMFARILRDIERETACDPVAVVVDVRADRPELHATLEALGFFPTVYYPAMIGLEDGRMDAVQFTWLHRRHLPDSVETLCDIDWPAAQSAIAQVSAG